MIMAISKWCKICGEMTEDEYELVNPVTEDEYEICHKCFIDIYRGILKVEIKRNG